MTHDFKEKKNFEILGILFWDEARTENSRQEKFERISKGHTYSGK